MLEFLTNPIFKYVILPIGSAILGVAVKYSSRKDQYAKFKKEDIAIGLDLALTACLMFVVLTTERAVKLIATNKALADLFISPSINTAVAKKLQEEVQLLSNQIGNSGWLIALMFLGLGTISTVVRKWGWKSDTEMHPVIGVAFPLAFGILAIIVVMAGATK